MSTAEVGGHQPSSTAANSGLGRRAAFPRVRWVPTSEEKLREAEERLMSYVSVPSSGRFVDAGSVNGDPCRIWTRSFNDKSQSCASEGGECSSPLLPLVMLHGMASGGALFCLNFPGLAGADKDGRKRTVYALDLPGYACSSRPRFSTEPKEAEEQYVAALEAWRLQVGVEKMCLLGHSLGGYLASAYALKHPDRLGHLILVDPWGFPSETDKSVPQQWPIPWYVRSVFPIVQNFNPLAALRASGPWGSKALASRRRQLIHKFDALFSGEEDEEKRRRDMDERTGVVLQYMYHCNMQTPTGEAAFRSLMSGFAWAKRPMFDRLCGMDPSVPVTAVYGGKSWVSAIPREELLRKMGREDREEDSYTKVRVIDNAGHHVYADQRGVFDSVVLEALQYTSDQRRKNSEKKENNS